MTNVRQKFTINANVILGALGMEGRLNIGSNISFGGITAGMATGGNYNVDTLTVISSLADMCLLIFGSPVESIVRLLPLMHCMPYGLRCNDGCDRCDPASELLPKIGKYVPLLLL